MVAGVSGKIFPKFSQPMDFGLTFNNKRIFGDHKTIRGLVCGTVMGVVIYFIQGYLIIKYPILQTIEVDNFRSNGLLGFLMPFGALMGDALKSFVKRQLNIRPGKAWFPFDQIDWLLGTLIASYFLLYFNCYFAILVISLGTVLHIIIKLIGYLLNLQTEKF